MIASAARELENRNIPVSTSVPQDYHGFIFSRQKDFDASVAYESSEKFRKGDKV